MKKIQIYISALLFLISFYSTWLSAETGSEFFKDLKAKVADAEKKEERVLVSRDNWLFFMGELRSISVGPFWGDAAKKVSRASKSKFADPLPAILEFKKTV